MGEAEYELKTLREVASGALTIADMQTALLWIKIADAHLSRQAELLGRAAKALEPFADGLKFYNDPTIDGETFLDWSENIKVADLRTASSTLDAIRDELKGDANGE